MLILILSGMSTYDSVSINYATQVSDKDVDADIKNLINATHWRAQDAEQTTDTANVPGAKPSTSVSFKMPRLTAISQGILPIEPFIDVYKRFRVIRINYLIQSPFQFAGLKNFENDFVKVSLKAMGNSYQYTVFVKNSDFDRAGLPMQSVTKPVAGTSAGISASMRIILIVGIALLVSIFVYFMAAYICRRRRTGE